MAILNNILMRRDMVYFGVESAKRQRISYNTVIQINSNGPRGILLNTDNEGRVYQLSEFGNRSIRLEKWRGANGVELEVVRAEFQGADFVALPFAGDPKICGLYSVNGAVFERNDGTLKTGDWLRWEVKEVFESATTDLLKAELCAFGIFVTLGYTLSNVNVRD